jgi:tetratricopeptide (TPR) repeat protein
MKAEPRHAGGNGPEPASHLRHGIGYAGAKTARSARRRERASACGAIRLRRGTTAASPRCGRAGNRAGLRWRPARYAEILAYYAAHGEAWDKLAIYARQAGRKAAGQSAYQEAIRYFEEALIGLQCLPEAEQVLEAMIETRFDMRNAFFPLGEIERDLPHLREAEKLAAKLKNASKLAWISTYIARDLALIGRCGR